MTLTPQQIGFLRALGHFFFNKIHADQKFVHARLNEYIRTMPVPKASCIGSLDLVALKKIEVLQRDLAAMEQYHSAIAPSWPPDVVTQYLQKTNLIKELCSNHEVDASVINLYHFHKGICHRALEDYDDALMEFQNQRAVLTDYIRSNPHRKWERYERNLILNLGYQSDILSRLGKIHEAVSVAEQMVSDASTYVADDDFAAFEKGEQFCPILSWAYYRFCEAFISESDWEASRYAGKRQYAFNFCFAQKLYKNWPMPVLFQILHNERWRARYPHYFEEVANLVYVGTVEHRLLRLYRMASVAIGRVEVRPAPAAIAGLLLAASIVASSKIIADPPPASDKRFELIFEQAVEYVRNKDEHYVGLSAEEVDAVRDDIFGHLGAIISDFYNNNVELQSNDNPKFFDTDSPVLILSSGSNEQGVGPGQMIT